MAGSEKFLARLDESMNTAADFYSEFKGVVIIELSEEWAKKGVLAFDMETAALFVVGRIRGMRTASILNVVAACKGNVAENIGRYVDGETLTAQGEEYEILTAFAALTRQ